VPAAGTVPGAAARGRAFRIGQCPAGVAARRDIRQEGLTLDADEAREYARRKIAEARAHMAEAERWRADAQRQRDLVREQLDTIDARLARIQADWGRITRQPPPPFAVTGADRPAQPEPRRDWRRGLRSERPVWVTECVLGFLAAHDRVPMATGEIVDGCCLGHEYQLVLASLNRLARLGWVEKWAPGEMRGPTGSAHGRSAYWTALA
jgi:hypothetical protein